MGIIVPQTHKREKAPTPLSGLIECDGAAASVARMCSLRSVRVDAICSCPRRGQDNGPNDRTGWLGEAANLVIADHNQQPKHESHNQGAECVPEDLGERHLLLSTRDTPHKASGIVSRLSHLSPPTLLVRPWKGSLSLLIPFYHIYREQRVKLP